MSTLSPLFNPFPAPYPRYYYDLSTELSPALQLSIPAGPHHFSRILARMDVIARRLGQFHADHRRRLRHPGSRRK